MPRHAVRTRRYRGAAPAVEVRVRVQVCAYVYAYMCICVYDLRKDFRFFPDRGVEARGDALARFDCSFSKIL